MIIKSASVLASGDAAKACWAGIRRFHNVSYVEDAICSLHSVPRDQKGNAKKQAEQIRYCLIQAKEYYDAAAAVSLATKPVLTYYSTMSLALAEILLKQDGNSSLDKARGQHAHHGLNFLLNPPKNQNVSTLENATACLRATPLIKNGDERFGTFELWHRTSRELPILGELTEHSNLGSISSHQLLIGPADAPPSKLQKKGITLLECLQYLPGMHDLVRTHGVRSFVVRGNVTRQLYQAVRRGITRIIIHPYDADILELFYLGIKVAPSDIELVNITELQSGLILEVISTDNQSARVSLPSSSMWSKNEVRFSCPILREGGGPTPSVYDHPLNEFGLFYVALYIAGNYARYYPDRWLVDVDRATPLALAVEELLSQAEQRVPLLALSELTRNYLVPD